MKKLLTVLLALSLLLPLSLTAAAEGAPGDLYSVTVGGVRVTATGWSYAPGADGAARLTLFLFAENTGDTAGELRCASCELGPCELPANLSLRLEPGESGEAEMAVPLTALSYFDLSPTLRDCVRLRFSLSDPADDGALPLLSERLTLRLGELPELPGKKPADGELFSRFGVRLRALGGVCDGRYLTAWLLLENNNDFPLRFYGLREETDLLRCTLCGGSVQAHSRAAVRVDLPLEKKPTALSFTLRCALAGYADGEAHVPVDMLAVSLPLRLEETESGDWTVSLAGDCEPVLDQSYVARVGLRSFRYDESEPVYEVDPDLPALPERVSPLLSVACCAGYEALIGEERETGSAGRLLELPLVLRSFTGEAVALTLVPDRELLWLPCLTAETLAAGANGSAETLLVFDAGGLAYTGLAGLAGLSHGFTLLVKAAGDQTDRGDAYPAAIPFPLVQKPAETCDFGETAFGELSFRLLGLDLSDGLSLWLMVRNGTPTNLPFGESRLEAMLNSAMLSLYNSGACIPAQSECLVLLRGAAYSEESGTLDPLAFRLPPLTELNTLKLRLGEEETLTLMFQRNGTVMFASLM